ncbi:MAG: hypothetical protein IH620_04515 [Ignavibacterium sp.]|nr:hypothetical protein [Ignavibacterium sp.]HCY74401.1 hypothetical protein [Ignavibacteriales bacterium]
MKKLIGALAVITIILTTFIIAKIGDQIPKGWFSAGSNPSEYEMGIDNTNFVDGHFCAYIKSKAPKENEFGTLMQTISAENYLGKRLQISGYIKSENVNGWSGMWMRIDGENNQQLGFDNMRDRTIKGTTDWKKYEIVLDIPINSKTINYGVLLGSNGKVWFDNFRLDEVDKNVQVTNLIKENKFPSQPVNLNFEEK